MVAPHMKETFKQIVSDDVLEDAHKIEVPVVLIYGDRDHATPQAYGALFAEAMRSATLHVIEGAGHFIHLEEPEEVNKIIVEFIS
jgi:pimeloyl-ACP methyl ester carboxylesterase